MTRILKNPKLKFVSRSIDRHGKMRWRFRRNGVDHYINHAPGSDEFEAEYRTCIVQSMKAVRSEAAEENLFEELDAKFLGRAFGKDLKKGSMDWLIIKYKTSPDFMDLKPGGKPSIRSTLDFISRECGELPFIQMRTHHLEGIMELKEGPSAANAVKKYVGILFKFAIRKGWTEYNPAVHAKSRRIQSDGYYTWTSADVSQFLLRHPKGSRERLAMLLFYRTGAVLQDVAAMTRDNLLDGNVITYARGKTGVVVTVPIMEDLQAEIDRLPDDQHPLLVDADGKAFRPQWLSGFFKDATLAAGLPKYAAPYGLRKKFAVGMAEAGATQEEIAAAMGHMNTNTSAIYTKMADRKLLAERAVNRMREVRLVASSEPVRRK